MPSRILSFAPATRAEEAAVREDATNVRRVTSMPVTLSDFESALQEAASRPFEREAERRIRT
jgi:hypothetical protein